MLDKLKHTLSMGKDDPPFSPKVNPEILSLFQAEDIKAAKKNIQNLKETLSFLEQIANTNKEAISNYINQQVRDKQEAEDPDEKYTFLEDLTEIKTNMGTVITGFRDILETETQIHSKVEKMCASKVDDEKYRGLESKIERYEEENKKLQEKSAVEGEMLVNSKMQTALLSNEAKQLQDRIRKLEKDLTDRVNQVSNLQEEKKHLLNEKSSANPEVEAMKGQLLDFEKRMNVEKTKTQQKEKEIEQLKKKIEEQKSNLISLADQLKANSLKNQKMTEKYESSKTEIRKFREQKMEETKKLAQSIEEIKAKLQQSEAEAAELQSTIKKKDDEILQVRTSYENAKTNSIKQSNLEQELRIATVKLKELADINHERKMAIEQLEGELGQMKQKRQALLQLVEQPTKHEISNLDKIHKEMEGLYKDYVIEVFDKKNIVGFERKIKDVMYNLMELREDLLM